MELDDLTQAVHTGRSNLYGARKEKGKSSDKVLKLVENMCNEMFPQNV